MTSQKPPLLASSVRAVVVEAFNKCFKVFPGNAGRDGTGATEQKSDRGCMADQPIHFPFDIVRSSFGQCGGDRNTSDDEEGQAIAGFHSADGFIIHVVFVLEALEAGDTGFDETGDHLGKISVAMPDTGDPCPDKRFDRVSEAGEPQFVERFDGNESAAAVGHVVVQSNVGWKTVRKNRLSRGFVFAACQFGLKLEIAGDDLGVEGIGHEIVFVAVETITESWE